jgi:hypothetical protein
MPFISEFLRKLSRKFRIFVTNISRKRKVSFRENFREKTKTKTFVPTLMSSLEISFYVILLCSSKVIPNNYFWLLIYDVREQTGKTQNVSWTKIILQKRSPSNSALIVFIHQAEHFSTPFTV